MSTSHETDPSLDSDNCQEHAHKESPESEEAMQAQLDLDAENQALQEQIKQLKHDVLLAQADAANIQRRAEKQMSQARQYANEKLAKELLPVLDSFSRCLAADWGVESANKEGVDLTYQQLISAVRRHGIVEISAQPGDSFDPSRHEATSMLSAADESEKQTIAQVLQPGYLLHDRVLRATMVIVFN